MSALPDPSEPSLVDRASQQARNGWGPVPLPTGKKSQPPEGFTGQKHPMPDFAQWYATYDDDPAKWGNLGARIPETCVGVDVDAYDGKNGAATFKVLGGGDWPETVVLSSRFRAGYDGTSGIRLYRLPEGIDQSDLWGAHDGIEILRFGHRYAVSPGSDHPEGGVYRCLDQRTRTFIDVLPPLKDIPQLTLEQGRTLTVAGAPWKSAIPDQPPRARDDAGICAYSMTILTRAIRDLSTADSRYGTMSDAVWALVSGEDEGHHLGSALATLRVAYFSATAADRKASGGENPASEFDRNVEGAREKVAASPTDEMFRGCCATENITAPSFTVPEMDAVEAERDDDGIDGWGDGEAEEADAPVAAPELLGPFDKEVRRRYGDLRVNEAARDMLAEYQAGQAKPLTGMLLRGFLDVEYEPERYRVGDVDGGLWPSDGRVLLPAAAKTGKTTLVACNLIPSLVDGTPFLGRYEVQPVTGTVVYLNLEVGPRTMQRWLGDAGIRNADLVVVENLRGAVSALTIMSPKGRRRVADWLMSHGAEVVILDPLAPLLASLGLDENSNADVARFFAYWSETLQMAGVSDDLVVHHTGHAGERSRGASRLLDEPDAIWTLTKDQAGEDEHGSDLAEMFHVAPTRFLQAFGRDVELAPEALEFDPRTRLLGLTGESRGRAKKRVRQADTIQQIRELMSDGQARSKSAIADRVRGVAKDSRADAVQTFIDSGHLYDSGQRYNVKYVLFMWTDNPSPIGGPR